MAARGDGKLFQRAIVRNPAHTPDQRALLAYDAARGIETLVVETTVEGEGDEFAWVLPLPARPEIEASTTGLFPTLEVICAPEVVRRTDPSWILALGLGLGLWGAVRWWRRPLRPSLALKLPPGMVVASLLLMCAVAPPSCAKGGGPGAPGAQVLEHQTIGVFDTTVLTATDAPSLRQWLTANGFAAPEEIDPVVTDLLRDRWVFVASKVRRDAAVEKGVSRLHPLAFTFPSKEAVFPMRLTGVGARSIALELFVCGDRRASADGLTVDHCEGGVASSDDRFSHEEFRRRAGTHDVLTKLSGRLDAAAMTRDVNVRWTEFEPHVTRWHTGEAAASAAAVAGALVAGVVLLAAALVSRSVAACRARPLTLFDASSFAIALVAGAAGGAFAARGISLVPDSAVIEDRPPRDLLRERLSEPPDAIAGDVGAVRTWATSATSDLLNPYSGTSVREEDSPGNWWIRQRGEQLEVVCSDGLESQHVTDVSRFDVVEGSVRASDGTPVPGAELRFRASEPSNRVMPGEHFGASLTARTDASGAFRMHVRTGGDRTWDVAVAPAGRAYVLREDVDARGARLDFILPREGSLRGRLLDADGRPVARATVVARPETPFDVYEQRAVETDADGWFVVPGLDADSDDVRVHVHVHSPPDCTVGRLFTGRLPAAEPFVLQLPPPGTRLVR